MQQPELPTPRVRVLPAVDRIRAERFRLFLIAGGVLVNLPGLILATPGNDASTYYARMAQAFAEGRWNAAFFHKIPPLYPVLAGCVARLTGLDGYVAGKIVGTACFVGALLFTWRLAARWFDEYTARWAAILFLFSARLIRYATNAGPDLPKTFFLAGLVWFACNYLERPRLRDAFAGALFAAAATLTRSECVAFAALFAAMPTLRPLRRMLAARARRGPAESAPPSRPELHRELRTGIAHSAFVALLYFVVFQPWMLYEYRTTGWWVLDSRYLRFLHKLGLASKDVLTRFNPDRFEGVWRNPTRHKFGPLRPLWETVKGFSRVYTVLLVIGLWKRWRDRRLSWYSDGLPAVVVVVNAFLFFACFGYVTKRYIATSQPFVLGWAATGLIAAAGALARFRRGPAFARSVLALLFAIGVWDGASSARPRSTREKRLQEALPFEVGRWIASRRERWSGRPPPQPRLWMYVYGRRPVIASAYPQISWAADAEWLPIRSKFFCTPEGLLTMCREVDADLVVWSSRAESLCKGLRAYLRETLRLRPIQTWQVGKTVWEAYELPHPIPRTGRRDEEHATADRTRGTADRDKNPGQGDDAK